MRILLNLAFLLLASPIFSQGPPPVEATAKESNKPIILEVAQSCHYELYFEHFKDSIIHSYASKFEWSEEKITFVKSEIRYTSPSNGAFYNAYSGDSYAELEKIKKFNLSLSVSQLEGLESIQNKIIIHNMINALDWKCKNYVD